MKITVIGDIMCEPPVLKTSKRKDGSYNFDGVFTHLRNLLLESDYVIGNIEFPLGGKEVGYTDTFFKFNAPDSFADAVKNAGIDMVSVINNHTLDRGADGMYRTLRVLEEKGIPYTGAFLPEVGHKEAEYFEVDGVKFALVAYTYVTNEKYSKNDAHLANMNVLRPHEIPTYTPDVRKRYYTWVDRKFPKVKYENRALIKQLVGLPATIARADDYVDFFESEPYIDKFVADIKQAKENADFVIAYPHVGGQFNVEPGSFSKYCMYSAVKAGADAVLASHSHMVQKAEIVNGIPCAYSLGNINMSPNSRIIIKKHLPDYGIAFHLYMENKKIEKVTFSILKGIEKKGEQISSWPVDELYANTKSKRQKRKLEKHIRQVYKYVTEKDIEGEIVRREYDLTK